MYFLALLPVLSSALLSPVALSSTAHAAPPPATGRPAGPPRVHVHDGAVDCPIAAPGTDATPPCPQTFTAVETAPLKSGPVVVKTWAGTGRPGDEPCTWQTLATPNGPVREVQTGRTLEVLPVSSERYRKLVGELVGLPEAQLTALVKVDLQGDGTDEILFAAESHPSPADQAWPMPSDGKVYSIVGVRRLVEGKVQTDLFFEHKVELTPQVVEEQGAMTYQRGTLLGVTDVEGDGVLEVVVGDAYYEGSGVRLWSFRLGPARAVAETGCGV